MKEFIFLYPIQPYVDAVLGEPRLQYHKGMCNRLNEIIDARYRNNGFGVNWVFFSTDNNEHYPDISLKARELKIRDEDSLLASGVNADKHFGEKVYPDPQHILDQVSPRTEQLSIGGFHQWDCVEKLAKAAFNTGLAVFVDEDTTELFFLRGTSYRKIPLIRDIPYTLSRENAEPFEDILIQSRLNKPWLPQVSH